MRQTRFAACSLLLAVTAAQAADIYILSSANPEMDAVLVTALEAHGHAVTVGVPYTVFDGTQSLAGFDAVYLQANYNWSLGDMPVPGQEALVDWVNNGGGLVTSEWVLWKTVGQGAFQTLAPIFSSDPNGSFNGNATATYAVHTPEPIINAGLPSSFDFPLVSFAGCETHVVARTGAAVFYESTLTTSTTHGLTGWDVGKGRVACFSTTCGPAQIENPDFGRLLGNTLAWTARACYANCDGSSTAPVLNVNDFVCFQQRFAAGDLFANCDGSSTPPVLNVNDFVCFQQRFAAGCQ